MGLTQSINIATQAMAAMQTGLTVVSHNVANVSTEGYHKLRTNFSEVLSFTPMTNNPVALAKSLAGVQVAEITRYQDDFMQSYFWGENGKAAYLEEYGKTASQIEDLMNELNDTGLAKSLSDFYSAVDSLNDNPSDIVSRQNFLRAAENLCDMFNGISGNLQSMQESTNGTLASVDPSNLGDQIKEVNDLLAQIAGLNESIMKTSTDTITSSSLVNQRDQLLTDLAAHINADIKTNSNGTVNIYLNGTPLLSGKDQKTQFVAENHDVNGSIVTKVSLETMNGQTVIDDANKIIKSGSLAALLDITGTDPKKLNYSNLNNFMNNLASEFAKTFNDIQTQVNANGTPMSIAIDTDGKKTLTAADPNENLFVPKYGTTITAASISLNDYFKTDSVDAATGVVTPAPYKIAAARIDTTALTPAEYKYAVGNNANATAMVVSRSARHPVLNGATFEGYLSDNVSQLGYQLGDIDDKLETQKAIVTGISNKMESTYGVNLDEELGDMLKYQQAYKASARIFNVCNDLIDVILNMG